MRVRLELNTRIWGGRKSPVRRRSAQKGAPTKAVRGWYRRCVQDIASNGRPEGEFGGRKRRECAWWLGRSVPHSARGPWYKWRDAGTDAGTLILLAATGDRLGQTGTDTCGAAAGGGVGGGSMPCLLHASVQAVAGQALQDASRHGRIRHYQPLLLRLLQHPLHQLGLRIAHHCGQAGGRAGRRDDEGERSAAGQVQAVLPGNGQAAPLLPARAACGAASHPLLVGKHLPAAAPPGTHRWPGCGPPA